MVIEKVLPLRTAPQQMTPSKAESAESGCHQESKRNCLGEKELQLIAVSTTRIIFQSGRTLLNSGKDRV